jgi:hypothetical protein
VAFDPVPYLDPTVACDDASIENFCLMGLARPQVPAFAYSSAVMTVPDAFDRDNVMAMPTLVQPTADLGDVPIPKGYRQALSSPHAAYWEAAINKELAGIVALKTWTPIARCTVPAGANILRSHYVFTVKRKSDGSIEKIQVPACR